MGVSRDDEDNNDTEKHFDAAVAGITMNTVDSGSEATVDAEDGRNEPFAASRRKSGLSAAETSTCGSEIINDRRNTMAEGLAKAAEDLDPADRRWRVYVFVLLMITQLVVNFDSGALASIYGMKPQGPHVVCEGPLQWQCPGILADGTVFPPTDLLPDVALFDTLAGGAASLEVNCTQAGDTAVCSQNNAVVWTCTERFAAENDAVPDAAYTCRHEEGDDLRQSLLHDPNFDDLYKNKNLQGLLSSIVYLGLSLGAVLTGIGFWYIPPQRLLQVSLILNAAFAAVFAVSVNRAMLFSSRVLVGVTQATLLVYAPCWVDEFALREYVSLWMSLVQAAVPLGIVAGYMTAGLLASNTSLRWSWSFYIQCILLGVCVLGLLFLPARLMRIGADTQQPAPKEKISKKHEPDHDSDSDSSADEEMEEVKPEKFSAVLRNAVVWGSILTITSLYFVVTAMQLWITDYLTTEPLPVDVPGDTQDDRYSNVVFAFGITAITGPVVGVILGGFILDSPKFVGGYTEHPNKAACFSMIVGCIAALFAVLSLVMNEFIPFIVCIWFTLCFGGAGVPGLTGVIVTSVSYHLRGMTVSFAGLFYNLFGYFAGPLLTGIVADGYGMNRGFQIAMGWGLVGAVTGIVTWVYAVKKSFKECTTEDKDVYFLPLAKFMGYKPVTEEQEKQEEEQLPLMKIASSADGVVQLRPAGSDEVKNLNPWVKALLFLAEYAEETILPVAESLGHTMRAVYEGIRNEKEIPLNETTKTLADAADGETSFGRKEPLYELYLLMCGTRGGVDLQGIVEFFQQNPRLKNKLRRVLQVSGEIAPDVAAEFFARLRPDKDSKFIPWAAFAANEDLVHFMDAWRLSQLPKTYVLTGFLRGSDRQVTLTRDVRDGLPYYWGPAPEKGTSAETAKRSAQLFMYSRIVTVSPGLRALPQARRFDAASIAAGAIAPSDKMRMWMLGTLEDFTFHLKGFITASEVNKHGLLKTPHRQSNWLFSHHFCIERNWLTTLHVLRLSDWEKELDAIEREQRPVVGATAAVMGITNLVGVLKKQQTMRVNQGVFQKRAQANVVYPEAASETSSVADVNAPVPLVRLTPAQLLRRLRTEFADSEITRKVDEAELRRLGIEDETMQPHGGEGAPEAQDILMMTTSGAPGSPQEDPVFLNRKELRKLSFNRSSNAFSRSFQVPNSQPSTAIRRDTQDGQESPRRAGGLLTAENVHSDPSIVQPNSDASIKVDIGNMRSGSDASIKTDEKGNL